MKFEYVAMDVRGEEVSGVITAATTTDAVNMIRNKGLFPTRVIDLGTEDDAIKDRPTEIPPLQVTMPVEVKHAIHVMVSGCAVMRDALMANGFTRSEAIDMVKIFLAQAMSVGFSGQKES
jgi:hypothetical protein